MTSSSTSNVTIQFPKFPSLSFPLTEAITIMSHYFLGHHLHIAFLKNSNFFISLFFYSKPNFIFLLLPLPHFSSSTLLKYEAVTMAPAARRDDDTSLKGVNDEGKAQAQLDVRRNVTMVRCGLSLYKEMVVACGVTR
ncbi:microtubule actin cross linking factor 1 [Sesbania bispinosa]|nr:microtubule actin cross linking factor 1 [Sesbania bispinosa]